jgi:ABC-type lipoprotein export system ATPase subunit
MPAAKFVVESETSKSFRASQVKSMFDCDMDKVAKTFDVDIPIEGKQWSVGLIIGSSGTGKTTISKTLFKDFLFFEGFQWGDKSIIDDFDSSFTAKQITEALSKVGFSSPPDWLKPFTVLSNGQKMRAELARVVMESDKPFIYDEFTSVVDRQVACIGSSAIQKYIRKENKQFIAVSCHYDIEEWLAPDWVYDCNKMGFAWRSLRRPEITCNIRKAEQSEWKLFKDFHYLSSTHNISAHKYICEIAGEPVAWCSVLHFPHPKAKNLKRIHRLVVRPDYQGIGVGINFLNLISKMYIDQGFRVSITTGALSLINGLSKSKNWAMSSKPSRQKNHTGSTGDIGSSNRLTATFEHKRMKDIPHA